ncbi:MAG: hypothetical protein JSW34_05350 [Candidatus Zixiibacteriota bacterium]|nr:MAG: hypothetical protein JSW34_05350 [candidate division Zixibacteria bacterium]
MSIPLMKTVPALAFLLIMAGCAANMSSRKRVDIPLPSSSRVAVLPFENLSGREKAAEKLTDYFQTTMTGRDRFELVEFGVLYDHLRQFRIRSSTLLTDEQIDSLAASLDLSFILVGSALEYEEFDNNYLGRVPQVSFNCRLIDCATGKTVWVATSNRSGDSGELVFGIGAVRSADDLARRMVSEAVDDLSDLFAKN